MYVLCGYKSVCLYYVTSHDRQVRSRPTAGHTSSGTAHHRNRRSRGRNGVKLPTDSHRKNKRSTLRICCNIMDCHEILAQYWKTRLAQTISRHEQIKKQGT